MTTNCLPLYCSNTNNTHPYSGLLQGEAIMTDNSCVTVNEIAAHLDMGHGSAHRIDCDVLQFYKYLITYLLTYSMEQSPSSEANHSLQLVKKFPTFYGIWTFFTVLTSARHLSLSWADSIQSPHPTPISWRSILILSYHLCLGLPKGLFPSGFPTNTLCTPLSSRTRATWPTHLILLGLIFNR
jgi:hypothetical protein